MAEKAEAAPQQPAAKTTPAPTPAPKAEATEATSVDNSSIASQALVLIAAEAALDLADLEDDVMFSNLGVDSLMSLVIAEKFRQQLGVVVSGSLFLEYPTIGDLRAWLIEYYS